MHAIGATLTSGGGTLLICVHRFTVAFAARDDTRVDTRQRASVFPVYDSDLRWFRTTQIVHRLYCAPRLSRPRTVPGCAEVGAGMRKGGDPRLMDGCEIDGQIDGEMEASGGGG